MKLEGMTITITTALSCRRCYFYVVHDGISSHQLPVGEDSYVSSRGHGALQCFLIMRNLQ